MKRVLVIVGILMVVGGLGILAFSGGTFNGGDEPVAEQGAVYHKVSAQEAKEMMGEGKDFVLLDVRTEEEFGQEHIEGAILMPDYEVGERAATELPDKEAVILVYCRSGGRSEGAARELVGMGYTRVYDMGGINDWPFETVSE